MFYYVTLNLIMCLQDEGQIRYHVVLDEKLLKNNLHNGMHRETMLGFSYQIGFFLHNSQVLLSALAQRNRFPAFSESSFNFKLTRSQKELRTPHVLLGLSCHSNARPLSDLLNTKSPLKGSAIEFDFSYAVPI